MWSFNGTWKFSRGSGPGGSDRRRRVVVVEVFGGARSDQRRWWQWAGSEEGEGDQRRWQ